MVCLLLPRFFFRFDIFHIFIILFFDYPFFYHISFNKFFFFVIIIDSYTHTQTHKIISFDVHFGILVHIEFFFFWNELMKINENDKRYKHCKWHWTFTYTHTENKKKHYHDNKRFNTLFLVCIWVCFGGCVLKIDVHLMKAEIVTYFYFFAIEFSFHLNRKTKNKKKE